MTLKVPVATVGQLELRSARWPASYAHAGRGQNDGVTLRVPYYLVPRAVSNVTTEVGFERQGELAFDDGDVKNGGAIAGNADFYAWGLRPKDDGQASNDLRAVASSRSTWIRRSSCWCSP